jgi:integrase
MARKRGQNEGTTVKRADGRWVAALNLGYVEGKRKRKWFYGKTRKEVRQALTKALRDQQQSIPITTERITVGAFLARWYEECVKLSPKPMTHRTRRHRIKNHLEPAFGKMVLDKLSPLDVQRYIARKTEQGLAASTINGHLSTLGAAMNQALRWGLIWRNPVALVDRPREEKRERRFLSPNEARKLQAAARGHRLDTLFLVLLTTGLRRSEARGLTWDDIDFERATLTVQRQTIRVDGINHTLSPKTARSRRMIALPAPIRSALVRQRERVADERDAMGLRWQDNNLVFPSPMGKPFSETTLARELDKICAKAGLAHVTPHELRHSMASFCAAANINPRLAMGALGHSTLEMTMEHYQHVTDAMRREVADSIGRLLFEGE